MKLDLDQIAVNIVKDRLAGMEFKDIARKYFLGSPLQANTIYLWKTGNEPLEMANQKISLEYERLEILQSSYWVDAQSGDKAALKSYLSIAKAKVDLMEKLAMSSPLSSDEIQEIMIDHLKSNQELGEELHKEFALFNEAIKDFEWPED
jgi:hypothetical protein